MKLRITGIATVLALALCLALLTTGASAQSVQKSVAHRVVTNLGGGPLPKAPAPVAPAPSVAPMAPAPMAPAPVAPAPRVAPAVTHAPHAMPDFGIGIATSHALADGGFLGNGLDNGCGDHCGNGLSGTSASGTAIGLGLGSDDGLGLGDLGGLGLFH